MQIDCPHCGKGLTAPAELRGKTAPCIYCQKPVSIPRTAPAPTKQPKRGLERLPGAMLGGVIGIVPCVILANLIGGWVARLPGNAVSETWASNIYAIVWGVVFISGMLWTCSKFAEWF